MSFHGDFESSDIGVQRVEARLRDLVMRLAEHTGADAITLFLYDAVRDTFFMPISYGLRDLDSFVFSRPRSDRIAGKVAKGRQPIVADDARSHPDMSGPFTFRERIISSAGFPIFSGPSVVGVCFISFRKPHHFTESDTLAVRTLVADLEAMVTPATVAEIGQRLIPQFPELSMVDKGLAYLVTSACNFIHSPFAIWVLDPATGRLAIRAATGLRHQFVGSAALDAGADNPLVGVLRSGRPATLEEPAEDPGFPFRQEAEHEDWHAVLAAPVGTGGQARGLVVVFSFVRRRFAEWEVNFLSELAGQAGEVLMREHDFAQIVSDPYQVGLALAARSALDQTLTLIVEKAAAAFRAPIVTLYPYDQDRKEFGAPKALGVTDEFWRHPRPSKTGIAALIVGEGQPILSDDAEHDPRMSMGFIKRQRVKSSAGCPLKVGNEVVGVLFINYRIPFKFTPADRDQLTVFANSAAMAIYNARLFAEERRRTEMAEFANRFNETLDRNKTLQAVVDQARELTSATSSSLFLWNSEKSAFELSARSPVPSQESPGGPRSEQGLTRTIIDQGKPIRLGDAAADPRVRDSVKISGIQSILGVPVQVKGERIGVLYVNSDEERHFTQRDEELIQGLANFGALAIERTRVLEAIHSVNHAMEDFLRLDDLVKELLKRIVEELRFEFGAVQLINLERNEIETVDGINAPWGAEARHSLASDDIQAYVARTRRTQVIAGKHSRFDRDIFENFGHEKLVRIFAPIVVGGSSVVGTVEAGFDISHQARITRPERAALEAVVAEYAPKIEKARLLHVLETVVSNAVRLIRADSGSIHVLYEQGGHADGQGAGARPPRYVYECCAGRIGPEFLKAFPPRQDGINRQVLADRHCITVDDAEELERTNRAIFAPKALWRRYPDKYARGQGVRALACFPLVTGGKYEGVLYVHFWREHKFTDDEIAWLELFADQVSVAIQEAQVFDRLRDHSRALTSISVIGQRVVESLTGELRLRPLLEMIARRALEALKADLITLYQYNQARRHFDTPPTIEGEMRKPEFMKSDVDVGDAQWVLVHQRGENVYAANSTNEPILYNPERKRPEEKGEPFVRREGIQSSAAVLLKAHKEIVGVMFVNYRSHRDFTDSERRVIENFASYAAIAIQAARTADREVAERLRVLRDINVKIASRFDLDLVLDLIVGRSMQRLRVADGYAVLHLYDESEETLKVRASANLPEGHCTRDLWLDGTETAARAARSRTSLLLPKDQPAAPLHELVPGMRSELAAPLTHNDRLEGVLTVGSRNVSEFDEADRQFLELLGAQAVVAIRDAERTGLLAQLRGVLADIASATDWTDALERVAQNSLSVLKADDAVILPYDPEEKAFLIDEAIHKRRAGLPEGTFPLQHPGKRGIGHAVLSRRLIAVDDILDPPPHMHRVSGIASLGTKGVRAFVGVVLEVARDGEANVLGVLYVDYQCVHHFTRAELDLLRTFAEEAAIVVQKARQEGQRQRLLQLEADLNSFGSSFAHRVGNLLGTLPANFGYALEALQTGNQEALSDHLHLLKDDVETVKRIIATGKLFKESQNSRMTSCDLNQCLRSALRQAALPPGVEASTQLDLALPPVRAVEPVITSLFADLIDNAVRAMPGGGQLCLASSRSEDRRWIVAQVTDTGKGMDERIRKKVCQQPFVSGRPGGLGLGLWQANRILRQWHGDLEVRSQPDNGTTIILRFPVSRR